MAVYPCGDGVLYEAGGEFASIGGGIDFAVATDNRIGLAIVDATEGLHVTRVVGEHTRYQFDVRTTIGVVPTSTTEERRDLTHGKRE